MGAAPAAAAPTRASLFTTFVVMLNNTVGAGLLSLPYTFKRSSLVPGVVAMLLTGALNCFSMLLIARGCELCGARSYMELATSALGARVSSVVSAVLALYTLGSCASYVVLLGDALPELAEFADASSASTWGRSSVLLPAVGLLLLAPLSSARNLGALRFTAAAALVCVLYAAGMIAYSALASAGPAEGVVQMRGGAGLFIGIPITMVSFTMHYNTPRLFFELERRSLRRMAAAGAACFGLALVLYESTAASGYYHFGAETKSDILANYADDDKPALAARVALAVIMVVSFPVVFNGFRSAFASLLPDAWQARLRLTGAGEAPGGQCGDWPFLGLTLLLVALSIGTALAVPNLGLILGYKGALGGTLIVYVLPGLFYFAVVRRQRRRRALRLRRGLPEGSAVAAPETGGWGEEADQGEGASGAALLVPASSVTPAPARRVVARLFSFFSTSSSVRPSPLLGGDYDERRATHTPLLWRGSGFGFGGAGDGASDAGGGATPALTSPALSTPAGSPHMSSHLPPLGVNAGAGAAPEPLPLKGAEAAMAAAVSDAEADAELALEDAAAGPEAWRRGLLAELCCTTHGALALSLGAWGFTVMVLGTAVTAGLIT